ncbi:MAG: TauD/TfdA family dioxygenase [Bryobacterales bacterium]|nr:TauD/TfdA family dioxygenase [Bryobacterales bacterium]
MKGVDLVEWLRTNHDFIEEKIALHGGVLFRGFGLNAPHEFERAASAVCGDLFAEYGDLPREDVAGKVYTSTPYPEDKSILYHNESSHLSRWPGKINFFCITAATQGGATPIVDCRKVYQGLNPDVRHKFAELGVVYVRNFCQGLDVSWQRFFGTEDPAVVEQLCGAQGMLCEWKSSAGLRVKQRCQAVLRHPKTGEMTFFNQVQLHHIHCLDPEVRQSLLSMFEPEDLPRHVYYGDGSTIEDSVMDHIGETYEKYAVRFQWRQGDMITLDNMLTAHARDPYLGPRKIVVALGNMTDGLACL